MARRGLEAKQVIVDLGEEWKDSGVALAALTMVCDLMGTEAAVGGAPCSRTRQELLSVSSLALDSRRYGFHWEGQWPRWNHSCHAVQDTSLRSEYCPASASL